MVAQPKENAPKPAKGGPTESGDRNTAAPEVEVLRREMGVGEGGEMGGDELQHRLSSLAFETAYFKRFRANVRKNWEGKMVF